MTILEKLYAEKLDTEEDLEIQKLYFDNWQKISKGDQIIEIESSKISSSIESSNTGYIEYLVNEGEFVSPSQELARIHDKILDQLDINEKNNKDDDILKNKLYFFINDEKIISRKAKIIIDQKNIDISKINKPFISSSDILSYNHDEGRKNDELVLQPHEKINLSKQKYKEIEAVSINNQNITSTIYKHVKAFDVPNSDNLLMNASSSYLPIIINYTSKLLKEYKLLNSFYHSAKLHLYEKINIGIALDNGSDLKVLTIRETDKLSNEEIESHLSNGIYKYFRKSLNKNDVTGSTFTISDLSAIGTDYFIPLINSNQSAILGIGAVDKMLNRFTICLTFDHRVTEGLYASKFLRDLANSLESFNQNAL